MRLWIQRGHCFRSRGSTGTAGEQVYVNDIANRVAVLLRRDGHSVKVALADERVGGGYDVFVALHCDGSVSSSASGASIGGRDSTDLAVGRRWKERYAARGWPYGFRGDNYTDALRFYYGTGWAAAAGITHAWVLEFGFLTNHARDAAFLKSEKGRTVAALSVVDTIKLMAGQDVGPAPMEDDEMLNENSPSYHIRKWQNVLNWHAGNVGLTRDLLGIDGVWGPITDAMWKAVASKTPWTVYKEFEVRGLDYSELRLQVPESAVAELREDVDSLQQGRTNQHNRLKVVEGTSHVHEDVADQPEPV